MTTVGWFICMIAPVSTLGYLAELYRYTVPITILFVHKQSFEPPPVLISAASLFEGIFDMAV